MKERGQAKDYLEAKWVGTGLCLSNGLRNCTLASDDALEVEKQVLDSFRLGLVCL